MSKIYVGYVKILSFWDVWTRYTDNHTRNLSWHTSDESLRQAFGEFGQIIDSVREKIQNFPICLQEKTLIFHLF